VKERGRIPREKGKTEDPQAERKKARKNALHRKGEEPEKPEGKGKPSSKKEPGEPKS